MKSKNTNEGRKRIQMNILRWRRKSKKKIKFKTVLLFVFSLIMTTFAWFAYSKVLNPTLNIHISSWNIQYFINNVEKYNPIGIEIPTLYPSMPEQTITIDILNNGERLVDIDYYLQTVKILGETYTLVQEGSAIPAGTENYVILTPTALETTSTTDDVTGVTTVTKTVKGAVTNDIERLPFTIEIEHSAEIDPVTVDAGGNETPGEGYLKVIVNWIGDNHELDSEWGYRVNEYLTTTGATSAITIDLVIDSYQIEEEQEVTVTMPKTAETAPYLPTGFVRVPGTTLETGLVIKDSNGNEYVWVEVPKNTAVYTETGINLDLDSLSETELEEAYADIETDLKAYSESFRKRDETFATTYAEVGLSETVYEDNKFALLKSIYKNGGFYIGRYETGYETENGEATRTANGETSQTPVIKANAYPYNYVTMPQAQSLASGMVTGTDYTSTLVYGLEWDLTLKYMNVKGGANPEDLNTDSTTIGNYYNNTHFVTNRKAKYSLDNGSTWIASPYEKAEADEMLLTTGANTTFSKQNIYDLAGNLAEWTYNVVYYNSKPVGGTGGDYTQDGVSVANDCGTYITTTGAKNVGFRVALFSNVDNGAVGGEATPEAVPETIPYMPTGFTHVAGTDLTNGYTIQDGSLNQYVWIEVPRNATVYDEVGTDLDLDSLSGTELTTALNNIETELQEYVTDYRKSGYSDTWKNVDQHGFASADDYNALKYTMLKSVYENGGFYIGRYETGTATARTSTDDELTTAVVQANAYPYNFVTNRQAQEIASGMASGQYTSSLMFGIQWDLVLKYLQSKGVSKEVLNGEDRSESVKWGNYSNNTYEITNTSAKYSTDGTTWTNEPYGNKTSGTKILLSTGADSQFSKFGIYDLAGNVSEWTLEQCTSNSSLPCAHRGGYYANSVNSLQTASFRASNGTANADAGYGFRVSLY